MSNLTLQALLKDRADSPYNDPDFMTFLDDHLERLRNSTNSVVVSVEPSTALKYKGDLFGLFKELGFSYPVYYVTMKMNNFTSPTPIQTDIIASLLVPDLGEVRKLYNLWRAHAAIRK